MQFCPIAFYLGDVISVWRFVLWHFVSEAFSPVAFCLWSVLSCDILSAWRFVLWHFILWNFVYVAFYLVTFCLCGVLPCGVLSVGSFVLWHFVYVAFCLVTFCLWEILCCDVLSCGVLSCDILSCGNLSCCIMSGNQTKWFVCVEGWNILGQWGDDSFAINHSKFFSFKGWFPTPRLSRRPRLLNLKKDSEPHVYHPPHLLATWEYVTIAFQNTARHS